MAPNVRAAPLLTDTQILDRITELLQRALQRRFWLLFLDASDRLCPTVVPVDGIPDRPEPDDAERFAPMLDWLADGEAGRQVIFVLERPGGRTATEDDRAWAAMLRRAAALVPLPVRAQLLAHDDAVRWLAPDDYA